jgi:hypothetical protein
VRSRSHLRSPWNADEGPRGSFDNMELKAELLRGIYAYG